MEKESIRKEMCTYIDAYIAKYCQSCDVCERENKKCKCWALANGHANIFGDEIMLIDLDELRENNL